MSESVASVILKARDEASKEVKAVAAATDKAAESADELADKARAADKAVGGMGQSAGQAAPKLDDLADKSDRARKGADDLGDAAGRMGSGMAKARGAASLLSPELGNLLGIGNDVADVLEVAAEGAGVFGLSLGPVAVALAAIAAVGGVVAAVYVDLNSAEVAAAESAEANRKVHEQLASLWEEERGAILELALAHGELTEAEAESLAMRERVLGQFKAASASRQAEISELHQQKASWTAWVGDMADSVREATGEWNLGARAMDGLFDSSEEIQSRIDAGMEGLAGEAKAAGDVADKLDEVADAKRKKAEADARAAEGARRHAEAERESAAALKQAAAEAERAAKAKHAAALAAINAADAAEANIASFLAEGDPVAEAELKYQQRVRMVGDAASAMEAAGRSPEEIADAVYKGMIKAAQERDTAIAAAMAVEEPKAEEPGPLDGGAAAALSDPLGAIAGAHPYMEAALAIAQAVSQLDDTMAGIYSVSADGAGGQQLGGLLGEILNNVNAESAGKIADWVGDVAATAIPEILHAVPEFVAGLAGAAPEIAAGLVEAVPDMAAGIVDMFFLLGPKVALAFFQGLLEIDWFQVGENFVDGMADAFRGLWEELVAMVEDALGIESESGPGLFDKGGWLDEAGKTVESWFTGEESFDTGSDHVARSGLKYVHAGERIVPTTGASSQRTAAIMGGSSSSSSSTTNVNLGSGILLGTPDQVIREIKRSMGPTGRRLGW